MIEVIRQTVETGNEDGARQLFDVLETLLILVCTLFGCSPQQFIDPLQEVPILGKHIPQLVAFLLQCGGNQSFEGELRVLALNALNWTVQ